MRKSPFWAKKSLKTTFSKKFRFLDIFLVLKHWVTLLKYKYHKKNKKFDRELTKKEFVEIFSNKNFQGE